MKVILGRGCCVWVCINGHLLDTKDNWSQEVFHWASGLWLELINGAGLCELMIWSWKRSLKYFGTSLLREIALEVPSLFPQTNSLAGVSIHCRLTKYFIFGSVGHYETGRNRVFDFSLTTLRLNKAYVRQQAAAETNSFLLDYSWWDLVKWDLVQEINTVTSHYGRDWRVFDSAKSGESQWLQL